MCVCASSTRRRAIEPRSCKIAPARIQPHDAAPPRHARYSMYMHVVYVGGVSRSRRPPHAAIECESGAEVSIMQSCAPVRSRGRFRMQMCPISDSISDLLKARPYYPANYPATGPRLHDSCTPLTHTTRPYYLPRVPPTGLRRHRYRSLTYASHRIAWHSHTYRTCVRACGSLPRLRMPLTCSPPRQPAARTISRQSSLTFEKTADVWLRTQWRYSPSSHPPSSHASPSSPGADQSE